MSASLVGSEMCIRDRVICLTLRPRKRSPASRRCSERARRTEAAQSPGAVSYTHLTLPTICSV
eukprot:9335620-Alexandrium_andersonii.AAC.1